MPAPDGFSWIDEPRLAGMARPGSLDELIWLRQQGVQVLISLTEYPVLRSWINEAGMLALHEPIPDMQAPTFLQIDHILTNIERAHKSQMGVGIHCAAGLGRTGTLLACYLVKQGRPAKEAIQQVRRQRPGSIETPDQEATILAWAQRRQLKFRSEPEV